MTLPGPGASLWPVFLNYLHMHSHYHRSGRSSFFFMQRIRRVFLLVMVLAGLGCGSAPVQEMSEARQAIEAARAAGAEAHAGIQLDEATSLMEEAEVMLNERRFRDARRSAVKARDQAIEAREIAQQTDSQ